MLLVNLYPDLRLIINTYNLSKHNPEYIDKINTYHITYSNKKFIYFCRKFSIYKLSVKTRNP
ncbi:hypothetical protein SAMN06264346_10516 [Chryseobacterium profundimaris]|uniref:Uncharacterized protein n=1 Tax=Chryseobacterium profundimaris TaxID=1387275 RepID=A0ABY1NWU7_9FLAO|nr:hypothetical protein SAMN06264346_10516 [Chryseobacterium profundimaris]